MTISILIGELENINLFLERQRHRQAIMMIPCTASFFLSEPLKTVWYSRRSLIEKAKILGILHHELIPFQTVEAIKHEVKTCSVLSSSDLHNGHKESSMLMFLFLNASLVGILSISIRHA
ncbi:hypothetical protein Hanom_Chr01g00092731 [Helianthus anomalus]